MGMTSAAEAKLDARVRPQISQMQSRTPYPKRRSGAVSQEAESQAALPAGVVSLAAARARVAASAAEPVLTPARPAPIRLTRRGRIVVGTLIGIGVAALAAVIWLAIAGQAQASGNARAGRPVGGAVARVVVKPGQTLWGIANQVDPDADPRVVIPEIVDINSLTSTAISVGQVLWVPRI